jgi:hypothetical protein
VTGPAAPVTQDGQYPDSRRPAAAGIGIGRAAALIGALTAAACAVGAFVLVALLLDGGQLRAAVIRLRAGALR